MSGGGDLLGIVLAGGASSRMGRDKAKLEIDGVSLLARAVVLLRDLGAASVVVSGDRPDFAGVPDAVAGKGPVGGLASVLSTCSAASLVAIPVDQPGLDITALRTLITALADAPAACFAGHPLPWVARVDDRLRGAIDAAFAERPDGPSMHRLNELCRGAVIPAPHARVLDNINTPADWAALR